MGFHKPLNSQVLTKGFFLVHLKVAPGRNRRFRSWKPSTFSSGSVSWSLWNYHVLFHGDGMACFKKKISKVQKDVFPFLKQRVMATANVDGISEMSDMLHSFDLLEW